MPSDIGLTVLEAGELLAGTLPSSIRLNVDVDDPMPSVLADSTQIHQILMNLDTNASKAIKEDQGIIDVKAQVEDLSLSHISPSI
ncbi:MAG: nitrogen-specific signal transduction histidine kinase [Candidatus Azotimanducaceae bacterium]